MKRILTNRGENSIWKYMYIQTRVNTGRIFTHFFPKRRNIANPKSLSVEETKVIRREKKNVKKRKWTRDGINKNINQWRNDERIRKKEKKKKNEGEKPGG